MSCLYSSPEVISLEVASFSLEFYLGRCPVSLATSPGSVHASRAPICSAVQSHTDFAVCRGQQRRFPHQSSVRRRLLQIISPAKTSTGFSRDLSSAISGFRSLCGREQRSSLKPSRSIGPAFWNLSLGRALALRTLAHRQHILSAHSTGIYGASNPGPMLWPERSRSRGIFQVVFLHSNWALSGQFSARDRPPNAGQIGFGRLLAH